MRHVDRSRTKTSQPPLSQWLYRTLAADEPLCDQPSLRLRIRLRGNNLHILCESQIAPERDVLVPRLLRALHRHPDRFNELTQAAKAPIYKLILYGRLLGQQRPVWVEPLDLNQLVASTNPEPEAESTAIPAGGPAQMIANESLARSGAPEAIARYLSETFSYLGVSIKVFIQKLTQAKPSADEDEPAVNKRLWVICNCDYSPDASLLAEPIAQKLRDLELKGFREAVIRSQVSGEPAPDWVLQVDLTRPEVMLRDWARWGDPEALNRLLKNALTTCDLQGGSILKDSTLHVFCNLPLGQSSENIDRETVVGIVAPLLEKIAPQGITAATVYGVRGPKYSLNLKEAPIWIEWLNLPASRQPERAIATTQLAQQHHLEALAFLLQRLLNPDLDTRLATGGYAVKLCYKDSRLHIMTEGLICPDQAEVVPPLEDFLRSLRIANLLGVRIYGRRSGQTTPLWHHGFDLLDRLPHGSPGVTAPEFASFGIGAVTPAAPGVVSAPDAPTSSPLWQMAASYINDTLCSTRLFAPFDVDRAADVTRQTPLTRYRTAQSRPRHLKTAIACAIFGLTLTTQIDWLTGRWLDRQSTPTATAPSPLDSSFAVPAQAAPSSSLSLQNAAPQETEDFNAEPFARPDPKSATTAAILAAARSTNPTFNNRLLDEKLALYQERLRTQGVPDVLVIGSSRAMRGIDPTTLQMALAKQGIKEVEIFNFGINGATAQVVDLIVRQILQPDELPRLIIWADGARAFNSGRPDRTFEAIVSSAGYQQLQVGNPQNPDSRPNAQAASWLTQLNQGIAQGYQTVDSNLNAGLASVLTTYERRTQLKAVLRQTWGNLVPNTTADPEQAAMLAELTYTEEIDLDGFLPLAVRFDPETYYDRHPRVKGAYDSDYESFALQGSQERSLIGLTQFLSDRGIDLVFINLPLTDDYLDPVRRQYEQEFSTYMQAAAVNYDLIFRDWGQRWTTQYDLFSDPSHLNRYGAHHVSTHLAQETLIPWPR
jgi:hypothetical protein